MTDLNDLYEKSLGAIDILLNRKDYVKAGQTLEDLYQLKPVRLTWFVRKARYLWLTQGAEAARDLLRDKITLNYCYDGVPEALELLSAMAIKEENVLESARFLCTLDLVQHYGAQDTSYALAQEELEEQGRAFWETGDVEAAQAMWEKLYINSDAVGAMTVGHYLGCCGVHTDSLDWSAELPNIQYIAERLAEENASFLLLAEEENQWQCFALGRMLAILGKDVCLLLPPDGFSASPRDFVDESAEACLNEALHQNGITIIPTRSLQQEEQVFDNRHLIIQKLIGSGGKLFTVLGSGCLMDDVALAGKMQKHFERFNFQLGDMLDTNFSAGWVGDYLKYLDHLYGLDAAACLDAPAACKFSIVIPARNSATTLRYTIQTCLEQDFPSADYEILVSDNSTGGNQEVARLCKELSDPRIRYIKTPRPLVLGRSFEFAFLQARGEFILSLGSDDGLLPWALHILNDVRSRFPEEPIIQWERGFYAWPGFNGGQENQFIIPQDYKKVTQPIFYRSSEAYLDMIAKNPQGIYALPLLYINSGFRREYRRTLLEKTGRMWDGGAQDIYTGVVNVLINASILNLQYPLSIAGMAAGSTGAVSSGNRGDAKNKRAVDLLNSGTLLSLSTLSMPEKLSAPGTSDASMVSRFVYRCVARGLITFEKAGQIFDQKALFTWAAGSCAPIYDQKQQELHLALYAASLYGENFYRWYHETIFKPAMQPQIIENYRIPKYQEGRTAAGGEVLDASKYGVENVAQAVHLFVERSNFALNMYDEKVSAVYG